MDVHDKATRSKNMSAIRGADTKPEIALRKALFARGYRYRLHAKGLPGKPDIVLKKFKTVIFVHGCFWHMHHCDVFKLPRTNTAFWEAKLTANTKRDETNCIKLGELNWHVLVVWECALRGKNRLSPDKLVDLLACRLRINQTTDQRAKCAVRHIPDAIKMSG